jgi:hypothetical protein
MSSSGLRVLRLFPAKIMRFLLHSSYLSSFFLDLFIFLDQLQKGSEKRRIASSQQPMVCGCFLFPRPIVSQESRCAAQTAK